MIKAKFINYIRIYGIQHTVGENIIANTKILNNYGAIQPFKFPIFR